MSLEYEVKKPKELSKINANDTGELLWWTYMLGISAERLLTVIDEVGNSAEDVKKLIKLKNSPS
jgi:hypothetical protein